MTSPRLVYEQTIDGLFLRGLKDRMTPALKAKLMAVGLDLDRKLPPAHTFEEWCRFVDTAARELYPELPTEDGYAQLGESVIDGFKDTFLGPALVGMLRVLGPRRALERAQRNFRNGNNYTEATLVELGPSRFELTMNEAGPIRDLTRGILLAGVRIAGAAGAVVLVKRFDAASVVYEVTW
jgi:uncharacterized protein (TIGR02265 family)